MSTPNEQILREACLAHHLNYVGTRGNTAAPVCVIGEAPDEAESEQGQPFVGPSGRLLDSILIDGGLSPFDCWFTNPYKVQPPANKIDRLVERGIALELYENQFFEELNEHKPTFIISCGKTPFDLLCPSESYRTSRNDPDAGFGKWRGSILQSPRLSWNHFIVPMYHPAFVLRQYSERDVSVFVAAKVADELSYYRRQGHLQPLPELNIETNPTADRLIEFLFDCTWKDHGDIDPIFSIDIETPRGFPFIIGIADSPTHAVSFNPWTYPTNKGFVIVRWMDKLLSEQRIVGQNFTSFDAQWLYYLGFNVNMDNVEDTMIRQHVLWPELPRKLEFQTFQYTRVPYYKDEGKGWRDMKNMNQKMLYNGKDCIVTYQIYQAQEVEFRERAGS